MKKFFGYLILLVLALAFIAPVIIAEGIWFTLIALGAGVVLVGLIVLACYLIEGRL